MRTCCLIFSGRKAATIFSRFFNISYDFGQFVFSFTPFAYLRCFLTLSRPQFGGSLLITVAHNHLSLYSASDRSRLIDRRSFVVGGVTLAASAFLPRRAWSAAPRASPFPSYPFSLGIASGDPTSDGFVLWTRLAPRPLEPRGGMPPEPFQVGWQIALDDTFKNVVQSGDAAATPAWAHSVHVEVQGLKPDCWYWYRFKVGDNLSPVGRTRTMPPANRLPERLRFAVASCQKYDDGYYTAYEHMCAEDLDLVVHLGDYIYENAILPKALRGPATKELFTLEEYRARYALHKSDPALQAAHAMAPWIVTWDDHEVSNNYANAIAARPDLCPPKEFLIRRCQAYQAYFEHMPLRRRSIPKGPDMLLYRELAFGRLAKFHVLDTRQYRTDQPQGDGKKPPSPVLLDENAILLGKTQETWLNRGLETSPALWNVLAQQIMMARVDRLAGPGELYAMDQWPGYEAERRRVLRHLRDHRIANPVVLTGDIHSNWANELRTNFDHRADRPAAVEFVGTSITSSGDGFAVHPTTSQMMSENPGVKFFNGERGYLSCEVRPSAWTTHYRTVPFVLKRDAPLQTRATFVVENGRALLNRVA